MQLRSTEEVSENERIEFILNVIKDILEFYDERKQLPDLCKERVTNDIISKFEESLQRVWKNKLARKSDMIFQINWSDFTLEELSMIVRASFYEDDLSLLVKVAGDKVEGDVYRQENHKDVDIHKGSVIDNIRDILNNSMVTIIKRIKSRVLSVKK